MMSRGSKYTVCGRTCDHTSHALTTALAIALFALTTRPASGQIPDSLSTGARVSLLTQLPGEPIYAAFAHSAFRFRDDLRGVDVVFNYGTFDASQPYFVARFSYGALDYSLSVYGMRLYMQSTTLENRSVIEQRLRLDPDETQALYQRLRIQSRPENRIYRYDFLRDNCSTILLDLLRDISGDRLRFDSTEVVPETYRELIQPYISHRPFYDLGIDLVLGAYVDQKTTYFERDFLPIELLKTLDRATVVPGATGAGAGSFVTRTDTLLWVGEGYDKRPAFPWIAVLLWIAVVGVIARSETRGRDKSPRSFRGDRWFFGVLGFLGLFLTVMWFGTLHYVTNENWNILWALPTHLIVVTGWHRIGESVLRRYFLSNAVLVALVALLWFAVPQHFHAAFYPLMVFISWRSWRVALQVGRRATGGPQAASHVGIPPGPGAPGSLQKS